MTVTATWSLSIDGVGSVQLESSEFRYAGGLVVAVFDSGNSWTVSDLGRQSGGPLRGHPGPGRHELRVLLELALRHDGRPRQRRRDDAVGRRRPGGFSSDSIGPEQTFRIANLGQGTISLQATAGSFPGQYLSGVQGGWYPDQWGLGSGSFVSSPSVSAIHVSGDLLPLLLITNSGYDTDFSNRDLGAIDLANANLQKCNLSGATLSAVTSIAGADFTSATLHGVHLGAHDLATATDVGARRPHRQRPDDDHRSLGRPPRERRPRRRQPDRAQPAWRLPPGRLAQGRGAHRRRPHGGPPRRRRPHGGPPRRDDPARRHARRHPLRRGRPLDDAVRRRSHLHARSGGAHDLRRRHRALPGTRLRVVLPRPHERHDHRDSLGHHGARRRPRTAAHRPQPPEDQPQRRDLHRRTDVRSPAPARQPAGRDLHRRVPQGSEAERGQPHPRQPRQRLPHRRVGRHLGARGVRATSRTSSRPLSSPTPSSSTPCSTAHTATGSTSPARSSSPRPP